jgi:hypothetical protein
MQKYVALYASSCDQRWHRRFSFGAGKEQLLVGHGKCSGSLRRLPTDIDTTAAHARRPGGGLFFQIP